MKMKCNLKLGYETLSAFTANYPRDVISNLLSTNTTRGSPMVLPESKWFDVEYVRISLQISGTTLLWNWFLQHILFWVVDTRFWRLGHWTLSSIETSLQECCVFIHPSWTGESFLEKENRDLPCHLHWATLSKRAKPHPQKGLHHAVWTSKSADVPTYLSQVEETS